MKFWDWLNNLLTVPGKTPVVVIPIKPQPPIENVSPVTLKPNEAPWMDWLEAKKGMNEASNNKELAYGWRYTSVPEYKTVVGADHAWCKMTVNWAMAATGHKYNLSAAAIDGLKMGTPCEKKYGAIKVVEHVGGRLDGHHHITFVDHDGDLGGNQHDSICTQPINPSDRVLGYRWPVKA